MHGVWQIHSKFSQWNCHKKNVETNLWCTLFFGKAQNTGIPYSSEEAESLHCLINKQLQQYQSSRNEGEKLVHVVKNQELLNTADRNLAKVTPSPKCGSWKCLFTKGCLPTVSKKVQNLPSFYMHLKNKDHTVNNTLFICITTGIFFILSLKRPFSNYEAIVLLIFVNHLPLCNVILLFRKICKMLDIT